MTLTRLRLRNFKSFSDFSVQFDRANILVGPNNSGKSTILDALRVLSWAMRSARRRTPESIVIRDQGVFFGYKLPLATMPIPMANVTKDYSDDDAVLDYVDSEGGHLSVILNPGALPTLITQDQHRSRGTRNGFFKDFPTEVVVIPTLAPFESNEGVLTDETVDRNRGTRLASRNFRNIWLRATAAEFNDFRELIESTWPNVSIKRPEVVDAKTIQMFFSERRRDREIYWSGFGFQIWLQFLTHMLTASSGATIVVDEPDIYLHADLQRRFLKLIEARSSQYILATHSTEIINTADVGNIVSVYPGRRAGKRVLSDEEYNELFGYIGSIDNVEVAKLGRVKRLIFFEGKDKKLMNRLAKRLDLRALVSDSDTLIVSAGGFGQWRKVVGAAWTMREVLKLAPRMFALFDRDFRTDAEVEEVRSELERSGITAKIWRRKEIENYLLEVPAIERLVIARVTSRDGATAPSSDEIIAILFSVTETFRQEVFGLLLSARMQRAGRKVTSADASTVATTALRDFERDWEGLRYRLDVVSGKAFLARLNEAIQERYSVSFTLNMLCDELRRHELCDELVEILVELNAFCDD